MLDVARRLVIVDIESGSETGRCEKPLDEIEVSRRAESIAGMGVDVLICGAVSLSLETILNAAGIIVIPQICGRIDEIVEAYLSGNLMDKTFLLPGCGGRRWRFRGGCP